MAITSQLRPTPALEEVWLRFWQVAGLLKPSVIKPVISTLEQRIVIRRLGRLDDADDATLRTAIVQMIG